MNKEVLVIGGTGDIGKAISDKFSSKITDSIGSKDLDLSNLESIDAFFIKNKNKYKIFVFCSGIMIQTLLSNQTLINLRVLQE